MMRTLLTYLLANSLRCAELNKQKHERRAFCLFLRFTKHLTRVFEQKLSRAKVHVLAPQICTRTIAPTWLPFTRQIWHFTDNSRVVNCPCLDLLENCPPPRLKQSSAARVNSLSTKLSSAHHSESSRFSLLQQTWTSPQAYNKAY